MTILVMRPFPDNEKTAAALRAMGYDVLLSPSLRFEALPLYDDRDANYDAVIVTSANALRGIEGGPILPRLRKLTLFAVGDASAELARQSGFESVVSANGDGDGLRELVASTLPKGSTLCYLAGADLSRDLTTELGERGYTVVTHTTYCMIPIPRFTDSVRDALAAGEIDAVTHYSRRSAKNFVEAVQAAGIEVTALSLPQCCISGTVAAVLREAGALQVLVAQSPDEPAIFEALGRVVPSGKRRQKI